MDERTREGIVQSLEAMLANNPYYEFLGFAVEEVRPDGVVGRLPYAEAVTAPAVAGDGVHGGVISTFVDAVGMGSVVARKGRPVPLVTEDLSVTYHETATEDLLGRGRVVSDGSTLVSVRVDVYPAAAAGDDDPPLVASADTTARLFE